MSSPIKISDWLTSSISKLKKAGVSSARLDSLILLEDCLSKDRIYILSHPDKLLNAVQLKKLDIWLSERAARVPMSYVRRKIEFYGREFDIVPGVFTPRPESEAFINLMKPLLTNDKYNVVDVGSGSGCLGITISLEFSATKVTLIERSAIAITTATKNAKKLAADIKILRGNLLKESDINADIVVANLPYVPLGFEINPEAEYEPSSAIFGGKDGLEPYLLLFTQISELKQKPIYVSTESLLIQHKKLAKLASAGGYKLVKSEGLVQLFKLSTIDR